MEKVFLKKAAAQAKMLSKAANNYRSRTVVVVSGLGEFAKQHKRLFKISRKASISLGFFATFLLIIVGVSALRNQQLCGYIELVEAGRIQTSQEQLCPNILDPQEWGAILANIFISPVQAFSVNTNSESETDTVSTTFNSLFLASGVGKTESDSTCTDVLNPECWLNNQPELQQTGGYTNMLLVGIDTRPGYPRLKNADSILLTSYSQATGDLTFISFPRDLYIRYQRPSGYYLSSKINAVYANDDIAGMNSAIEQISGRKVHYYAYIDLNVFEEALYALGGVTVEVEEGFTDYFPPAELPDGYNCQSSRYFFDGRYCGFTFEAGTQRLTPEEAMAYARARKITSDYGRSARQQDLVFGLLNEVKNDKRPLTEKLNSYVQLYQSFVANVKTNVQPKDIAGMFALLDSFSQQSARVLAAPSLEDGRFVYEAGIIEGAGYSSKFRDESYTDFKNYISELQKYLPLYLERPKVLVINASGSDITPDSALNNFIQYNGGYAEVKIQESTETLPGNIKLYSFNSNKNSSLKYLQNKLPQSLIFSAQLDGLERTDFQEDIVIVVGGDAF